MEQSKRKRNRLPDYDYASCGAYFITVCVNHRKNLLWRGVGADIIRPPVAPLLSDYGRIVNAAIHAIPKNYPGVRVEKYCIMPDHIHMILFLPATDGRLIAAPTVSTIVGQMKRWVSRQIGFSIWQKSFYDRVIRNNSEYLDIWQYIDENPLKWQLDIMVRE